MTRIEQARRAMAAIEKAAGRPDTGDTSMAEASDAQTGGWAAIAMIAAAAMAEIGGYGDGAHAEAIQTVAREIAEARTGPLPADDHEAAIAATIDAAEEDAEYDPDAE